MEWFLRIACPLIAMASLYGAFYFYSIFGSQGQQIWWVRPTLVMAAVPIVLFSGLSVYYWSKVKKSELGPVVIIIVGMGIGFLLATGSVFLFMR